MNTSLHSMTMTQGGCHCWSWLGVMLYVQGYMKIYTLSVNWHGSKIHIVLERRKADLGGSLCEQVDNGIPVDRDKIGRSTCASIQWKYLKKWHMLSALRKKMVPQYPHVKSTVALLRELLNICQCNVRTYLSDTMTFVLKKLICTHSQRKLWYDKASSLLKLLLLLQIKTITSIV